MTASIHVKGFARVKLQFSVVVVGVYGLRYRYMIDYANDTLEHGLRNLVFHSSVSYERFGFIGGLSNGDQGARPRRPGLRRDRHHPSASETRAPPRPMPRPQDAPQHEPLGHPGEFRPRPGISN